MKKCALLLLAFVMLLSLAACGRIDLVRKARPGPAARLSAVTEDSQTGEGASLPFADVSEDQWYYPYVKAAYENGLVRGVTPAAYQPKGELTLAEVVTMAARIFAAARGEAVPTGGSPWYQSAYEYCVANGVIDGAAFAQEELERTATRFEMAAILDGAVPEKGIDGSLVIAEDGIPDLREEDEYGELVYRWYRAGIVSGDGEGYFHGEANVSRAEAAKILYMIDRWQRGFLPVVSDFSVFSGLDATQIGCRFGYQTDEKNRPLWSIANVQKYGGYNAAFLEADSDKIYLTIDEGYEAGRTSDILDVLKEKEVHVVFFLTGSYVRRQPEIVQRMIDEGHVLGNHSDNHPDMTKLSLEEAYEDTRRIHDAVAEQFGYELKLYRFPSGNFSEQLLAMTQSLGYRSLFWSFAYRDWLVDDQPDPDEALEKILDSAHPGGIYLLHAVSSTNAEILGDVIDGLRERGFELGDPQDLIQSSSIQNC